MTPTEPEFRRRRSPTRVRGERPRVLRATRATTPHVGPAWFGPAYSRMMARDVHATGSVDRVLLEGAKGLDGDSAPALYAKIPFAAPGYRWGTRPALDRTVRALVRSAEAPTGRTVGAIVRFTSRLGTKLTRTTDDLRFGGHEEEIMERGSDWCTDLARVACVLLQVAGVSARIVYLADTARAYSGHAVVEAFWRGEWGAADPVTGVVYRTRGGRPAGAWTLRQHPTLVRARYRDPREGAERSGQFRTCAIVTYRVEDSRYYDFSVTTVSPYYRSILAMAHSGWPGGLRWLHGEADSAGSPRVGRWTESVRPSPPRTRRRLR